MTPLSSAALALVGRKVSVWLYKIKAKCFGQTIDQAVVRTAALSPSPALS